jgi:hypothetical protein
MSSNSQPMTQEQGAQLIEAIGLLTSLLREHLQKTPAAVPVPEYCSIDYLAERWDVSRGTVYNRLRSAGAVALDFSGRKQSRSKRSIPRSTVLEIESKFSKRVS